ncbi:MAG: glucosamine-6-phosphate deaminase [Myxococcaceae bacterium]
MAFVTEADAAKAVAEKVARSIHAKPDLVLALPTGRTPLPLYRELVRRHLSEGLSFKRVHTFNLDEFRGIGGDDPASFRAYMDRHLFSKVDLDPARIHFLDGLAENVKQECDRYEAELRQVGGLDLAIVGIGGNGHVAFNEPGPAVVPWTHLVKLDRQTRISNAPLFGDDPSRVPLEAFTMGLETILRAAEIALIATGSSKAEILAQALEAEITPKIPASLLRKHPRFSVYADEAACSKLESRALSVLI